MRALTWNVHKFIGRWGRRDHDAVMHAVRDLEADIVALQEVDERSRGPEDTDSFVTLGEAFGWYSSEARTIRSPDGDYGHLLMSRWPMHDNLCLDLTQDRREPRMALSASIQSPEGPVRVIAAHLGLSGRERRRQLSLITDHLNEVEEAAAIVLGDFNEWRRVGPATDALCPPFEIASARPTFPSRRPFFALDRIWCRRPLTATRARVVTECCELSDHLPVVADLEFEASTD